MGRVPDASCMTRVGRIFLAVALLLAPILHPAAMAAPELAIGSAHHCSASAGEDADRDDSGSPHHGIGAHVSCAVSGACDLQTVVAGTKVADRSASIHSAAGMTLLAGLDIPPDPWPPRAPF
jgi:hypothetical protein